MRASPSTYALDRRAQREPNLHTESAMNSRLCDRDERERERGRNSVRDTLANFVHPLVLLVMGGKRSSNGPRPSCFASIILIYRFRDYLSLIYIYIELNECFIACFEILRRISKILRNIFKQFFFSWYNFRIIF